MAKQPYFVNTSDKQMDVQLSFDGGMYSQAHPEKLNDNQSVIIENADIVAGGVIQARGAYQQTNSPSSAITGITQGRFRYVGSGGAITEIAAINGNLYTVVGTTYTKITITNLASFQTTRTIQAVQSGSKLYIATGSGLVVYDGATCSLVQAYAPTPLEALYIGTNGYAANPDQYLSDGTGASDTILGVIPNTRYGVINQWVTFTTYVSLKAGDTVEYQFERKRSDEVNYTIVQVWGSSKTLTTMFDTQADYQLRISLRKVGTTVVLSQYILPKFRVNNTPDENPEPVVNFTSMQTCNRIFIHYDRLMLYGDTTFPEHLYSSQLNKFDYFPRTFIVKMTDPLRSGLQSVKPYKDFLVCFTQGSIQGIRGTNPKDFVKFPIHTTLGSKWGDSVQVMRNYISFVGNDNGIYILKSFNYSTDDKMNVDRIDSGIKDMINSAIIEPCNRILSAIYNDQYYLYIESQTGTSLIYRFYYETGRWVRDSVVSKFSTMYCVNNTLYLTSDTGGSLFELKPYAFKDVVNTPYNMRILSKDYTFGLPHHRKKLKQYQILSKMTNATTINVKLYTDKNLLSTTNLQYDATQNTDAQKLKIMASGRFRYVQTDITITVNELVQLIGFGFVYKLNTPK